MRQPIQLQIIRTYFIKQFVIQSALISAHTHRFKLKRIRSTNRQNLCTLSFLLLEMSTAVNWSIILAVLPYSRVPLVL